MEPIVAILLVFALALGAANSQPNRSTEFVGDARLALQVVAERSGKTFRDETGGQGQALVRFDAQARRLQGVDPIVREIARQLPHKGWLIVIRERELVLQHQGQGPR